MLKSFSHPYRSLILTVAVVGLPALAAAQPPAPVAASSVQAEWHRATTSTDPLLQDTEPLLQGTCDCDSCYSHVSCGCVASPSWSVSTGVVFLNRSDPSPTPLYQDGTTTIGGSDLSPGWQAGYELEFIKHGISRQDALVARLLVVDGWSAPAQNLIAGATNIATNPAIVMAGPRVVNADLSSDMLSFELNYVWQCEWMSPVRWMVGMRTFELDELLNTQLLDPAATAATGYHMVGTQNRLYGVQVGTDFDICGSDRLAFRGVFSAGIYGNTARHQSFSWDDATPATYMTDRSRSASLVGETGLAAKYLLTPGVSLRADYRVLWASGLALAPEQVGVTSFPLGTGIDDDATAFFHGFFVGVDWTF